MAYKNIEPIYAALGARIKAARKLNGMSQEELSKVLGLCRVSVANVEAGRQRVMFHHVVVMARVIGLPLDWPEVNIEQVKNIQIKAKQARYAKRIRKTRKRIEGDQSRLADLEKLVKP